MIGALSVVLFTVYAVLMALTLIVLWRLVILLPMLTDLAVKVHDVLPQSPEARSPERRLLEVEDLFRLNRITQAEYDVKREEILKGL